MTVRALLLTSVEPGFYARDSQRQLRPTEDVPHGTATGPLSFQRNYGSKFDPEEVVQSLPGTAEPEWVKFKKKREVRTSSPCSYTTTAEKFRDIPSPDLVLHFLNSSLGILDADN